MNVETGQIYEGMAAIMAAAERGESVVAVSPHVANAVRIGNHMLKKQRGKVTQKRKRIQSKKDRKRGHS